MANYETLKSAIQQVVKTNGNNEITGALLQQSLLAMINSLGFGYQFVGVATLATNPGTPDQKVFYIANGTGTYTNFDGISITEDEVVILYYDTAWHKLLTGIASQDKLAELEQDVATKQDALTLTIKDNGNIVIANIQGQSKEFMPATPSGDPMHYAYEAAGAVWNGTGADIVKTTPWADMVDDDADRVVTHKAGCWYLNGLGDITNEQMRLIYNEKDSNTLFSNSFRNITQKTNIPILTTITYVDGFCLGYGNLAEVISFNTEAKFNKVYAGFRNAINIRHILGVFYLKEIFRSDLISLFLSNCPKLISVKISNIKISFEPSNSPLLSCKSILYMIQNEAATSAITITLHANAYARAMANADIVAALQAHPNVSLASA